CNDGLLIATVVPGNGLPSLAVTTPLALPVVVCVNAGVAMKRTIRRMMKRDRLRCSMGTSFRTDCAQCIALASARQRLVRIDLQRAIERSARGGVIAEAELGRADGGEEDRVVLRERFRATKIVQRAGAVVTFE